ncbi:MAG: type I-C CRISPR-associated endonuclease Cas1c [Bacillota bacterium]
MRKLLNTLYILEPKSYLAREGENVLVREDEEIRFRVPVHNLEGMVCFGYAGASPALMELCMERGVYISFVSASGHFLARITGRVNGNVLLRRKQYRMADDAEAALRLAQSFVLGKVYNCRCVLQRFLRDHGALDAKGEMAKAIYRLGQLCKNVEACRDPGALRGLEGEGARGYYGVFDLLVLDQKDEFFFKKRSRRPPLDPLNALLSFLYTLLAHECNAALETVGLDPQVGFLHQERPGRPGLALDLMEELRPYLVDRLALSMVNNRQIDAKGFQVKESGGVVMEKETKKEVIIAWQKRKQEEVVHPFLGEKLPVGLIPYAQALLLARFVRGDMDAYPPFLMK